MIDAHRLSVSEVLDRLAELVSRTEDDVRGRGISIVGATVGVAGLLDRGREVLTHGPNLGWRDVPVGAELRGRIAAAYPVTVDNEGNLAAIAEARTGDRTAGHARALR